MKKLLLSSFAAIAFLFALLQTSCNESTSVGSDLLDQDQINISYIDTFKVITQTVREDSVVVQVTDNPFASFPVGIITDPIMGDASADVYTEFFPATKVAPSTLNSLSIDSVVLSMQYDTTGYGNTFEPRSLEVYKVSEIITASVSNIIKGNVYSKNKYAVENTPIGKKENFIPRIKWKVKQDSVNVTTFIYNETKKQDSFFVVKRAPHLRIQLDKQLGKDILALDSLSLNDDAEFRKKFKGLWLKPTSQNKSMIGFWLNNLIINSTTYNPLSNITIYYKDKDTRARVFALIPDGDAVKVPNYKHNFTNRVKNAVNSSDSTLFLQGMAGTNIKVQIPNLSKLKNSGVVVNKAELEFYAQDNKDGFMPAPQIVAVKSGTGIVVLTNDALLGANSNYAAFGGKPVETTIDGVKVFKYTLNLSYFVQKEIDGISKSDAFYITTNFKPETAVRTVFYGAKHLKFAPKLKLYYTKI